MTAFPAPPNAPNHSLARLMLMGLLSGIISALIAASTMLALANYQFYTTPHFGEVAGSAVQNYADDLPSALIAAFLWFLPVGIFVFPLIAKLVGASTGGGTAPAPEVRHAGGNHLVSSRRGNLPRPDAPGTGAARRPT